MGIRETKIAGNSLIIHELDNVYDSLTGCVLTGSWLWDSALVLSDFISSHVDFQGKTVLELGAGAGLPGLTAARLGATRVVLTDIKPLLRGLVSNVEANGLGDRVEVRELVWGYDEAEALSGLGEFDFVLMSDVFFDPEGMVGLGKTLKNICGRSTRVWAASEERPWTGECLKELVSQGFRVIELPSQLGIDSSSSSSSSSSYSSGEDGDESLNVFALYELIPPTEENCHVANMCAFELFQ